MSTARLHRCTHIGLFYSYMCLCLLSFSSLLRSIELKRECGKCTRTADRPSPSLSTSLPLPPPPMKHLTSQRKHDILIHCESRRADQTECDVAALHGATVDRKTIRRWRSRWDRTPSSLERHAGTGATPILTPAEVSRHVRAPILAANRAHRAVSYTKLLPEVVRKTGKAVSIQTLRRVGHAQLQVASKHTRKRTSDERQSAHTNESARGCVCRVCDADL